jgi:hypothetical protein
VPDSELVEIFNAAMVAVCHRAKREAGYNARYLMRMLPDLGGYATAHRLLHNANVSDGFTAR